MADNHVNVSESEVDGNKPLSSTSDTGGPHPFDAIRAQLGEVSAAAAFEQSLNQSKISVEDFNATVAALGDFFKLAQDTGMDKILTSAGTSTLDIVHSSDKPTIFAHLGFRALYTLIAWFVLGKGITQGTGFFVSVFLFIVPLFMDYLKFDSNDRRLIRMSGIIVSIIGIVFSLMGLIGILSIVSTNSGIEVMVSKDYIVFAGVSLALSRIWMFLAIFVGLTVFDWWFHDVANNQSNATGGNENG